MNGARNLACGSPSPTAGTGEVNSWPTSESLLHSRRCELPFEISIFYAYTWVICRRLAYRYRRATQFRLVRRRRGVHLRTYTYVCVHARMHTIAKLRSRRARKARALSLSQYSALPRPRLRLSSPSLARPDIIVPWSGESRPLCATPVHASGKRPPILSRDSSPSKWSPLDLNSAAPTMVLSCGTVQQWKMHAGRLPRVTG